MKRLAAIVPMVCLAALICATVYAALVLPRMRGALP